MPRDFDQRPRDSDRERYQRTFGRGRDFSSDAFYGSERHRDRSPEASRYDAEDFGGGAYDRDFERRYEEWHRPWHAEPRGGDFGGYGYRGYRGRGYEVGEGYRGRPRFGGENYSGRGPRGYRRSDERITEEINDRLSYDPDLDATDIDVQVANGVVTLSGIVEDRGDKRLAEDIVEDVLGVDDVNNALKVRHGLWARVTGEHVREREVKRETEREDAARSGVETGRTRGAGKESTRATQ